MKHGNHRLGGVSRFWWLVLLTITLGMLMAGVVQAAPLAGAIFTTTPDGSIVNENVRYQSKLEVYLDGGPGPNAPQTAAGLPDGDYYFQVTDPSGKVLLSMDPAKCREVHVSGGVITALNSIGRIYVDGKNTVPCSIQDPPTPPYDPKAVNGVAGPSGRHDTNQDIDHGPPAIVVQLMPFFDTPNPGGVYKAWMIPVAAYQANGGDPNLVPVAVKERGKQVGFERDPGFGPARDEIKTDNFKVKEFYPPEITVHKFNDLNGNGVRDPGEPEIGVDQCVNPATGAIAPCPGGWPYTFTEPVDGGTVTNTFYTPHTHVAGVAGSYKACEVRLSGWTQTAAYLDGVKLDASQCVTVQVAGKSREKHEIWFGNFKDVSVTACKLRDADGNLATTNDQSPIPGWTVYLTKNGSVQDTEPTGPNGCYTWRDLPPVPGGYYDVGESVPPGWKPLTPTSKVFESPPTSGASYSFTFVNQPLQGCTPGYWKNHPNAWPPTGYSSSQKVSSVFSRAGAAPYTALGSATLLQGLEFQGGDTIQGAAEILLRAGISAVLNASTPGLAYSYGVPWIVSNVNAALDSQNRDAILNLATLLDKANNAPAGCPLN